MKEKFKKKIPLILFIVLLIIGILIMLYPVISSMLNSSDQGQLVKQYDNEIATYNINKEQLLNDARKYNATLNSASIYDAFTKDKEMSDEYKNLLKIDDSLMMGYITIPKIDVEIPIYHGTSPEVLQKGVGHVEGSSLPVGGTGTHSVLSAHRGLPSAKLFSDLDKLENGDIFYITVLGEKLAYKVNDIKVIEPYETESLQIDEAKDYVTLVTCTPYAINTHRLLVRGERTTYNEEEIKDIKIDRGLSTSDIILYAGFAIVIGILVFSTIKLRKLTKKIDDEKIQK